MNKFVQLMTAVAATGALFLAPAAMAQTTTTHHHHHKAKTHKVMEHKAAAHERAKTHARTPQQEKMARCAHQSKGMKGKAHTDFMSRCLKK